MAGLAGQRSSWAPNPNPVLSEQMSRPQMGTAYCCAMQVLCFQHNANIAVQTQNLKLMPVHINKQVSFSETEKLVSSPSNSFFSPLSC